MGVCKEDNGNCAGKPDDDQMEGEFIHMVFDTVVSILSLDITGDHTGVDDGALLWYSVDEGANWAPVDIGGQRIFGADLVLYLLLPNKTLDYTIEGGQMYLSVMDVSEIPVPPAFWLFGTALLGFISDSRRTRV